MTATCMHMYTHCPYVYVSLSHGSRMLCVGRRGGKGEGGGQHFVQRAFRWTALGTWPKLFCLMEGALRLWSAHHEIVRWCQSTDDAHETARHNLTVQRRGRRDRCLTWLCIRMLLPGSGPCSTTAPAPVHACNSGRRHWLQAAASRHA